MAAPMHEILFEGWKHFPIERSLITNRFMMNLKLQNAPQRRFVFVEYYIVSCCYSLRDFLERSLRFWIIRK